MQDYIKWTVEEKDFLGKKRNQKKEKSGRKEEEEEK